VIDISFTQHDIDVQLAKLRIDKAASADGLCPRLLSETKQEISYPLFILFRQSLDEASVPDDWRCANVCPIFKKGIRSLPENYRPVSVTSQICKIFKAVIRDAVVQHLESNCLINDSQHGFRKGYSCLTNILTFLDKATGLVDTGSPVTGQLVDTPTRGLDISRQSSEGSTCSKDQASIALGPPHHVTRTCNVDYCDTQNTYIYN